MESVVDGLPVLQRQKGVQGLCAIHSVFSALPTKRFGDDGKGISGSVWADGDQRCPGPAPGNLRDSMGECGQIRGTFSEAVLRREGETLFSCTGCWGPADAGAGIA